MVPGHVAAGLVVVSHLIRSFFEDSLKDQLKHELSELRVEVHRTRTLVGDYNRVLEGCEADLNRRRFYFDLVCTSNICFALVCIGIWLWYNWTNRTIKRAPPEDSNFELPALTAPEVSVKSGPTRPSDLAKRRGL